MGLMWNVSAINKAKKRVDLANLDGAILTDDFFTHANFEGATLKGADLTGRYERQAYVWQRKNLHARRYGEDTKKVLRRYGEGWIRTLQSVILSKFCLHFV